MLRFKHHNVHVNVLKPSFVVFAYLRAAAPAADPETKHQERQFLLKFFLDITFQILEDKKPPQNVGETMPPSLSGWIFYGLKICLGTWCCDVFEWVTVDYKYPWKTATSIFATCAVDVVDSILTDPIIPLYYIV